jgi:hypothetical protein
LNDKESSENPSTESSSTTVKHFQLTPLPPLSTTVNQFLPTTNFVPTVAAREEMSTETENVVEEETVTVASPELETSTSGVSDLDIATTVQQPDTTQVELTTTTTTIPSTTITTTSSTKGSSS